MHFTTRAEFSNNIILHWKTENYGVVGQIARKVGVTPATVSMVLHGKRRSEKVEREIARQVGLWVRAAVQGGEGPARKRQRQDRKVKLTDRRR